jgi:hypothetical protein
LNFGYFYDRSPAIAYDGETPPSYTMGDYTPSTVPGARMPHVWLNDGRSVFDAMGPGYTLLRYDPACDVMELLEAARRSGVPLTLLELSPAEAGPARPAENLLLVRPDTHIAWRGHRAPSDPEALIRRLTGRAAPSHPDHERAVAHALSGERA